MEYGSTLVVTSPAPGEGKTTCACNLAVGFAQAGQRTLLLDMDMRRPRVRRVWGIEERESSLLHALGDEPMPDFAALTHETDVKGLDVIVSQHSSQFSPSEIIGKPRTRELIDWARAHYDRVVIDSPPVGIAADAMLLGGLADSVLVVIRFNRTRKSALGAAVEQLRRGKANVLGVVVNDVVFSKFEYGYRHPMYSYYSGYHAYSKYVVADARASREKQA
jgi:capsular exopolysaccharide synthesis family protein